MGKILSLLKQQKLALYYLNKSLQLRQKLYETEDINCHLALILIAQAYFTLGLYGDAENSLLQIEVSLDSYRQTPKFLETYV